MSWRARRLRFPARAMSPSMPCEKAEQLGAKVVTVSDSTGWIYDPEGIDVALLKDVKEVAPCAFDRIRRRPQERGVSRGTRRIHRKVRCGSAVRNAERAAHWRTRRRWLQNGCIAVAEGANMPTTLEATQYLQENGVLFAPGKAANAGGVATSRVGDEPELRCG